MSKAGIERSVKGVREEVEEEEEGMGRGGEGRGG